MGRARKAFYLLFFLCFVAHASIYEHAWIPQQADSQGLPMELPVSVVARSYDAITRDPQTYAEPAEMAWSNRVAGALYIKAYDTKKPPAWIDTVIRFYVESKPKKNKVSVFVERPCTLEFHSLKALVNRLRHHHPIVTIDIDGDGLYGFGHRDAKSKVILQGSRPPRMELDVHFQSLKAEEKSITAYVSDEEVAIDYKDVSDHVLPPLNFAKLTRRYRQQKFFIPFRGIHLPVVVLAHSNSSEGASFDKRSYAEAVIVPKTHLQTEGFKLLYRVPLSVLRYVPGAEKRKHLLRLTRKIEPGSIGAWLKEFEVPAYELEDFQPNVIDAAKAIYGVGNVSTTCSKQISTRNN